MAKVDFEYRAGKKGNELRWVCSCTALGRWHKVNGAPEEIARTIVIRSWQKHLFEKRCKQQ